MVRQVNGITPDAALLDGLQVGRVMRGASSGHLPLQQPCGRQQTISTVVLHLHATFAMGFAALQKCCPMAVLPSAVLSRHAPATMIIPIRYHADCHHLCYLLL